MRKIRLTSRAARKLSESERRIGIDSDDEASRWLAEHDPQPEPEPPKAASKSRNLHRWRRRQGRENG